MNAFQEICKKYGYGQSDIAARFGIPLCTVQGWYLGERNAPQYVIAMIDEILKNQNK